MIDQLVLKRLHLLAGEVVGVEFLIEVFDADTPSELLGHQLDRCFGALLAHPLLRDARLQTLAPALERAVDRLGRGRKPPLQGGERKPNRYAAPPLSLCAQPLSPIHLLADVLGNALVEQRLLIRQGRARAVSAPLRKQRPPVEAQQLLLDQPPHHVARVDLVLPIAEATLEAVGIEQREEQLEVLLLAGVRGSGHQEEVARERAELLAEAVALGLLDLVAVAVRGHLVRLVDDHQVPVAHRQLVAHLLVARQLIQAGDQTSLLDEGVAALGSFDLIAGQDLEVEPEAIPQLVLPLRHEAARSDDQAALNVAADHQLLDVEARHDRLARARVIGEQEAQRLARQHAPVDGVDLVGKRIEVRGLDGEKRIEHPGEVDAPRL